jgi:hypothetical protein
MQRSIWKNLKEHLKINVIEINVVWMRALGKWLMKLNMNFDRLFGDTFKCVFYTMVSGIFTETSILLLQ